MPPIFSVLPVITEYKTLIFELLRKKPELRDDDHKLYAYVLGSLKILEKEKKYTGLDILKMIGSGVFIDYESVRRCRAKLQQEHIFLRGKKYDDRQKFCKEVKKEVLNF